MRVWLVLCLALVTLPCAGDPAEAPAARAPAAPAPPAPPATATPTADNKIPDNLRIVTIDPNARPPVCKRVVPTGSRIAERRCETQREPTAADEANRTVLRRDFEAMRDQQMMREQARQAAMAEALRRRGQ